MSKNSNGAVLDRPRNKRRFVIDEPEEVRCQARVEQWSPDKAKKQIAASKTVNRNVSDAFVLELAQAIEDGEWQLNGETIKIDVNGNIIDGQHRLHAIAMGDKTVPVLTVRNLPAATFDTVDRGRARTMGDILTVHGEINANVLGAALSWLWKYQTGNMQKTGRAARPRAPQSMEILTKNPGLRESISAVRTCRLLAGGMAGALHYLFGMASADKASAFFESLSSGVGLKRTQAAYVLRERLVANKGAQAKLHQVAIAALVIKAWNAEFSGQPIKCLRWTANEEFPKIAGLK